MEPTHLNPLPDDDNQLTALLRSNSPMLPDDGFSARVLTALPPRSGKHWMLTPLFIGTVIVGAAGGFCFAWLRGLSWSGISNGFGQVGHELAAIRPALVNPGVVLALALTAVSLLIPFLLARQKSLRG